MGYAYAYKCRKCGYEENFKQGYGFQVHSQTAEDYLKQNKKLFHYKTHRKIVELAQNSRNLQIKATFQIYMCPACRLLFDKAEIKVYDDGKPLHKSRFRCSVCGARLKLTNIHRLKIATCPVCKKKTFKRDASLHGLWD